MKIEICKFCKTRILYAKGIGSFCPNKKCKNIDGIIGKSPNECFEIIKIERGKRIFTI